MVNQRLPILGSLAVTMFLAVGVYVHIAPKADMLFGEPFDSNVPVQWDSDAASDISLSRYFNSPSAHLAHRAPHAREVLHARQARTQELELVSARVQSLGQGKDWSMKKWSPEHYKDVASGQIDKKSVKGIWHNSDEAWAGIDDILPTDTPYAYEMDHSDYGESAKLTSYIDHVRLQLHTYEKGLAAAAHNPKAAPLLDVIKSGERALNKIEAHVRADESRGTHNAAGGSDADYGLKAASGPHIAQLRQLGGAGAAAAPAGDIKDVLARAFAAGLGQELSAAAGASDAAGGETKSQSCSLCIQIFGCPDCCQPVCAPADTTAAAAHPRAAAARRNAPAARRAARAPVPPSAAAAAATAAATTTTTASAKPAAAAAGGHAAQGLLGAYGEESDDAVWPGREPAPGKSEQVASGASAPLRDLLDRLRAARAGEAAWRRAYQAEAVSEAAEAREVRLLERVQIEQARRAIPDGPAAAAAAAAQVAAVPAAAAAKGQPRQAVAAAQLAAAHGGVVLPYYEMKGQGARRAVAEFAAHPRRAFRNMAGHPLVASD